MKNNNMELCISLAIIFAGIVAGLLINPAIILVAMVLGGAVGVASVDNEPDIYVTVESDEEES